MRNENIGDNNMRKMVVVAFAGAAVTLASNGALAYAPSVDRIAGQVSSTAREVREASILNGWNPVCPASFRRVYAKFGFGGEISQDLGTGMLFCSMV